MDNHYNKSIDYTICKVIVIMYPIKNHIFVKDDSI